MTKISIKCLATVFVVLVFSSFGLLLATPATQQPNVTRKILLKQDAPVSGYEEDLVAVEIPAGGREGRHTHPGSVIIYVQEGTLTFDCEGKPTATYKPGDTLYVEPDKIHEGRNLGNAPVKVLATFLVRKGVPLTSPAQ
jgi:quercetin dioxygenase-like cupin family protein